MQLHRKQYGKHYDTTDKQHSYNVNNVTTL